MKKFSILLAMALFLISSGMVSAETIVDVYNGNGMVVKADVPEILQWIHFSAKDKSTEGGKVKFETADHKVAVCKGGEKIVGVLDFELPDKTLQKVESEPFIVPANGMGPVVLRYKNPSSEGNSVVVFARIPQIVDGGKKLFILIPWEERELYFARTNAKDPAKADHVAIFRVEGSSVSNVVDLARESGWVPASEYWAKVKGIKFPSNKSDLSSLKINP